MTGSANAILQDACAGRCSAGGSAGYYKYGGGLEGGGARFHFTGGRRIPKSSVFACVLQCFLHRGCPRSNTDLKRAPETPKCSKNDLKMAILVPMLAHSGALVDHLRAKFACSSSKMAPLEANMTTRWLQDGSTMATSSQDGTKLPS